MEAQKAKHHHHIINQHTSQSNHPPTTPPDTDANANGLPPPPPGPPLDARDAAGGRPGAGRQRAWDPGRRLGQRVGGPGRAPAAALRAAAAAPVGEPHGVWDRAEGAWLVWCVWWTVEAGVWNGGVGLDWILIEWTLD